MPNFFSAFTNEVFKPLVTLLIPGAIGISTWFIGFLWYFPGLQSLVHGNHTEVGLVLVIAITFAGMCFEDLGARVETRLDELRQQKDKDHTKNWFAYLRNAFEVNPVGRGYIRNLVLRLKFELGIAWAMLSAGLGLLWLGSIGLSWRIVIRSELICLVFVLWVVYEAVCTHDILAENRANLLGEIRIVGCPKDKAKA